MRTLTIIALAVTLALAGCGTSAEKQLQRSLAPDVLPGTITALTDLKRGLANLPLLAQDVKATHAYAAGVFGKDGRTPDPVKFALADACPTAVDAISGLIGQTIDGIIAQLQGLAAPDPNAPSGFLMLFLTQIKYGTQPDPKAQLTALRAQLDLQMDALFTGCMHLFPKKQMNDVLRLAAKAGVTGFSGGTLAPLMGILP